MNSDKILLFVLNIRTRLNNQYKNVKITYNYITIYDDIGFFLVSLIRDFKGSKKCCYFSVL